MAEPRPPDRNRVLTVPNVVSVIRLALVPVFLWLLLVEHANAWATGILMFTGASDWADGKIARLMNQSSRLGELLDPAVDRIYMITVPIAFAVRHFVPWWFVLVLIARDGILAATLPALRSRGLTSLPVTYIGKGATFALMSGFPLILLGQFDGLWSRVVLAIGWGFTIWGFALYLWSFVLYMAQFVLVMRRIPKVGDPTGSNVGGTSRPQGSGTTGDEQRD
jgi:cardiolipin synthase